MYEEFQVTVIYSNINLVTVTSECRVKRVICKIWTETFRTLANSADQDQMQQNAASVQDFHFLLQLQEVKGYM